MTLTKDYLDEMLYNLKVILPPEKYEYLLNYYSEEPDDGYSWTEADIYEQVRKYIIRCR